MVVSSRVRMWTLAAGVFGLLMGSCGVVIQKGMVVRAEMAAIARGHQTRTYETMAVKAVNHEPVLRLDDGSGLDIYGTFCNVAFGGTLTVMGRADDHVLVRYTPARDEVENACLDGTLFFVKIGWFRRSHSEYEGALRRYEEKRAIEEEEKSFVRRLFNGG